MLKSSISITASCIVSVSSLIQALSSILFIVFMVQPISSPYMYLINVQSLYLNPPSIVGDWMGGGHKTFH